MVGVVRTVWFLATSVDLLGLAAVVLQGKVNEVLFVGEQFVVACRPGACHKGCRPGGRGCPLEGRVARFPTREAALAAAAV